MAFIKRMTIIELFATTILKCHKMQQQAGLYFEDEYKLHEIEQERIFLLMLRGKCNNFFRNIIKYNNRFIKNEFVAERVKELEELELKSHQLRKNDGYAWVTKFGKRTLVEIDQYTNDANTEELRILLNKDKIQDIFRDIGQILLKMSNHEDDGQEKIQKKENPLSYIRKKY